METRPKVFTTSMHQAAAEITVARMVENNLLTETETSDAIRDLVRLRPGPYADGYYLAKELDDHFFWSCNMRMAEALDEHSFVLREQLAKAQTVWCDAVKPRPPLPVGAHVRLSDNETGEITGIYDRGPAQYLVKIDGDPHGDGPHGSRRIVNFEDVKAA